MYKIICSLILILLVVPSLPAQEKVSFDTITSRMAEQLNMYPKEKLHVHIDRSCSVSYTHLTLPTICSV